MTELKPCPFCGSKRITLLNVYSEDDPDHSHAIRAFCQSCHTGGPHCVPIGWTETSDQAIEQWNIRKEISLLERKLKIAVEALKLIAIGTGETSWADSLLCEDTLKEIGEGWGE